ncbi:MAG: acyl-phosphate glycerol 3-phosphate acyltransferase [Betaproteobacteria bacterium CG2_30_68_42]|nr:MAG: acyl-phosphate glycerol 3-phosphate acyltransferase [Betaproteobacteria bacterium CG2_30_68_42]PJA56358.1 MAG: acyl-phosphate glycerol 3-phosphate acyltransferase [Rhodocyclales bacterium CG_4_9_14_3_um_filter_68_10]
MNCPAETGPGPAGAPDAGRLLAIVRALVAETHPGRAIEAGLDSDLERELGLDSLARVELLMRIRAELGVAVPEEALSEANTPRALLRFLAAEPAQEREPEASLRVDAGETGVPERARTLVEALDWHADRHPDRLHILLYGERGAAEEMSYGALREEARGIATGLAAHGLVPRQTVALMLPTGREYLASFFGVLLAGGVPVPIYPPARLSQIEEHLRRHARILANAEAALMITVGQARGVARLLAGAVPSLRSIVTPDELKIAPAPLARAALGEDLAFLQYTSGSTGDPKGVMLTHANLLANIRAMGQAARVEAGDVFVSWLPLYHDMGLIGAWLAPLYFGFPLVLMSPLAFLARPVRWLEAIARHRGTISGAPNFAYELLARRVAEEELRGLDLSSWRLAFNGAEPVSPATLEAFAARLAPFGLRREALTPVYGLAECSVCLAIPPLGRGPKIDAIDRAVFAASRVARPAAGSSDAMLVPACGLAIPGHAMRIIDAGGAQLPERAVGRLQFRGPSATQGYFRNPEASAGLVDGDWRETGDYAYLAEGEVYLTGRSKDVIIRGGRNLYPYELEQAVGALPGVRRGCVAVFGSPDPANRTERLVVLAETREEDAARREALRSRIVEAAVDVVGMPPDEVVLAPPHTVLKTSSGKIRRAASRELYERGLIGAGAVPVWMQLARLWLASAARRARDRAAAARGRMYGAWVWTAFLALALPAWALTCALRRPPLARRIIHFCARAFLALIGAGLPSDIAGRLPARPHVLVANHGSYLDAIVLVAALPPSIDYAYVAKREFLDAAWTRWFFSGIGALMVERFDVRRGVEDVDAIVAALAAGRSVMAFPEGTFTPVTGIRSFRMGAFVAAARAGVPVVAAGLRGVRAMLRDRTWLPRPGRPRFEIGAVVAPLGAGWKDAVALREAARAEIVRISREPDLQ